MIDRSIWERWNSLQEPGSPSLLFQLIELFLSSSDKTVEEIKAAHDKHYTKGLTFHAHALKSSAASLGALLMRDLCLQIETESKAENYANMPDLIARLEVEHRAVAAELKQELQKSQGS